MQTTNRKATRMALVDSETGEIIEASGGEVRQCSQARARDLTAGIRSAVSTAWDLVVSAYTERAWSALGYSSWDLYCATEFDGARIALPREQRAETVRSLRDAGLSTRAIAAATGVGIGTVARDLAAVPNGTPDDAPAAPIMGVDGKRYAQHARPAARAARAAGIDEAEAEVIADEMGDATADEVADAIDANLESKTLPTPRAGAPVKPDLGDGISHPARYGDNLIPVFIAVLDQLGDVRTVLDPFAGTGRIHRLSEYGYTTTGIELEPEWAKLHPQTAVGSALDLPYKDKSFDAVVTSPTYGNRLADSHNASDPESRRSYTHDLGRKLSDDNSGAMQWGEKYRRFHEEAWSEAARVTRRGGYLVLNIKDHVRNGKRQHVAGWHVTALCRIGYTLLHHVEVEARSMRAGANSGDRMGGEMVYVFQLEA